jgi:hypothetical protein
VPMERDIRTSLRRVIRIPPNATAAHGNTDLSV